MSVDVMSLVLATTIPTGPKFVLAIFADHANDFGGSCFPSVPLIMDKTSSTENTVRKHIQWLETKGFISRVHSRGSATHYLINLQKVEEVWVDLRAKHREAYRRAAQIHVDERAFSKSKLSTISKNLGDNPLPKFDPLRNSPPQNLTPSKFVASTPKNWGYNHHITINKSSSTVDEKLSTTQNPSQNLNPDAHQNGAQETNPRLGQILKLVSDLESRRGKGLRTTPNDEARISVWIQKDVTNEQILAAHETACFQRFKQNDQAPVSISYLDSILASQLGGANGASGSALNARFGNSLPWYATDAGIEKRANEKGYSKLSTETFLEFKNRVLAYEQVSPQQYQEALRTARAA